MKQVEHTISQTEQFTTWTIATDYTTGKKKEAPLSLNAVIINTTNISITTVREYRSPMPKMSNFQKIDNSISILIYIAFIVAEFVCLFNHLSVSNSK